LQFYLIPHWLFPIERVSSHQEEKKRKRLWTKGDEGLVFFSRSLNILLEDENPDGFCLWLTFYPGVRVLRAYVFRPINTKQEA
jgi:hypothetical protein